MKLYLLLDYMHISLMWYYITVYEDYDISNAIQNPMSFGLQIARQCKFLLNILIIVLKKILYPHTC